MKRWEQARGRGVGKDNVQEIKGRNKLLRDRERWRGSRRMKRKHLRIPPERGGQETG